ncbi:hypothetical protein F0249_16965 [Vibrio sp. 03-59-1]|uniref:hypothetical protein n=1 Tax=Vibrio sp. 03-59-1 TaxID=2607607 RepID=UPI0011BEF55B|nr:hypothetical protein [Vibrio sp. 03-59-1]NOH85488.1 hypothetical protein [Vibrio sp. 03-59-1]
MSMWYMEMHEYYKLKSRIKDILIERGYKEVKPDTDLDYCGSMHSIYASGKLVRTLTLRHNPLSFRWTSSPSFCQLLRNWQNDWSTNKYAS